MIVHFQASGEISSCLLLSLLLASRLRAVEEHLDYGALASFDSPDRYGESDCVKGRGGSRVVSGYLRILVVLGGATVLRGGKG